MAGPSVIQRRPETPPSKPGLVYPGLKIPFILLIACFAAWGSAANLTDVLVGVFRHIFDDVELPVGAGAVRLLRRLLLAGDPGGADQQAVRLQGRACSPAWGWPRSVGCCSSRRASMLAYGAFLVALFVLAAGLSILETSANPFVIAMGPEESATQRLNLAQAFNPVGANIGVLLGAVLILPNITPEAEKASMTAAQLEQAQEEDLSLVLGPYLGIALALAGDLDAASPSARSTSRTSTPNSGCTSGRNAGRGAGPPVAQPPLPLRRGRPVPQRRRPGLRVDVHHPVRAGRGGCAHRAVGVVPAGQPDPVPRSPGS